MKIFQHGWAFDSHFWEGEEGVKLDRGYFASPIPFTSTKESCTTVTHSFGLHLLSPELIQATERLIIMGGFCHLEQNLKTRAYLKWLKKTLLQNPKKALSQFYKDCGVPQREVKDLADLPLLLEDLERMEQEPLDLEPLKHILQIEIIHGERDRIAPLYLAEELHGQLLNSSLIVHPEGDHVFSLP